MSLKGAVGRNRTLDLFWRERYNVGKSKKWGMDREANPMV